MVTVSDLAGPTAIIPNLKISSKKQALQELSAFAAKKLGRDEREIFDVLLQRERLGTTGLGYGVAIPHGKLSGLEKITGIFARLEKPVDFESLAAPRSSLFALRFAL
ncbi:MAG: PTS sugar transporter subunit IIA, partial [Sphingomonadales bacterium]